MKHFIIVAVAAVGIFAAGCSSTTFTEYRGQADFRGKGGTVRRVDDIDFWENGTPDRKYRILGVIDDSRGDGIFARGKEGPVAKVARERGGDAVIVTSQDRDFVGMNENGTALYRRITKMSVVKYLE